MRLLIAGSWTYPMYEQAFAKALLTLGCEVVKFSWGAIFQSLLGKFESKYTFPGPLTKRLNNDLKRAIIFSKPDVVLAWRPTHVFLSTLNQAKKEGVKVFVSYNHDDFTGVMAGAPVPWHHRLLWRRFLSSAPRYDLHFVKRESNVEHLAKLGCKSNHIMQMWFDPGLHRPTELTETEKTKYSSDITFVGHYEPDGREQAIRALVEADIKTRIWGGHYWCKAALGDFYERLAPIEPVEGVDYAKALCGAKVCLCFLSRLNRDSYTRRCFEIPACGKVMLTERTDDLLRLFKEDEEACFFSSNEELVEKARWLIDNPDIRERIANAGLKRVWADGHDVTSRARQFLEIINTPPGNGPL